MADKLQETVNRENALHGETLIEDTAHQGAMDAKAQSGKSDASEAKRADLKARIAAGQHDTQMRDLASQARGATDAATRFAKEHPVATVLGLSLIHI